MIARTRPGRVLGRQKAAAACDAMLVLGMLATAVGVMSMALLAQAIRAAFVLAGNVWTPWASALAADDVAGHCEFGVGKLERAGALAIAGGTVMAGLWIAGAALEHILVGGRTGDRLEFALAATVNAVYGARWLLPRLSRPSTFAAGENGILQWRLAIAMQSGLTLAALAPDGAAALVIDALLALAVSLAMLGSELVTMRSRGVGHDKVLEVIVDPADERADHACWRIERARLAAERAVPGLRVSMHWSPPSRDAGIDVSAANRRRRAGARLIGRLQAAMSPACPAR
jgi:hypothetical protein